MEELLHRVSEYFLNYGYMGIFIMLFLESTFFPLPSELALYPAGYYIAKGEMNLVLVIVAGTLGSMGGASFNYFLGRTLGRDLIIKYGKYVLLDPERFYKMEKLFERRGALIVFIGRFIAVVRQYISFPPGVVKMNYLKFVTFTGLGAFIYVSIVTGIGYYYEIHQRSLNSDVLKYKYYIMGAVPLFIVYKIIKYYRNKKR